MAGENVNGAENENEPKKSIGESIDEIWKLLAQYNLVLKRDELFATRFDRLKNNIQNTNDDDLLEVSTELVTDFLDKHTADGSREKGWIGMLPLLWDKKMKFKCAQVYSCSLSFRIKDFKESEKVMDFLKSKNKALNGQVGTFGHGDNPADAFKNAVNALHAEYFGQRANQNS